jgi:hypothetical protein
MPSELNCSQIPASQTAGAIFKEKAAGRYTVGLFLRLPARSSGAIASVRRDCDDIVNENLTAALPGAIMASG